MLLSQSRAVQAVEPPVGLDHMRRYLIGFRSRGGSTGSVNIGSKSIDDISTGSVCIGSDSIAVT